LIQFPRATEPTGGWTLDVKLVRKMHSAQDGHGAGTMEATEAVLLAAERWLNTQLDCNKAFRDAIRRTLDGPGGAR